MNTDSSLKRPYEVLIDHFKLLVCKICGKDNVVLNLKTCGCLLCESCDGDSQNICNSCRSKVAPKIKLSFTKNPRCKFYETNECFSNAKYKCKCIANCLVCSSCLTYIHDNRVRGCCVPEMVRPKVTTNHEPCQLCKELYAGFRMTSQPYSKICLDCKTNSNAACTPIEAAIEETSDREIVWDQIYKDLKQSSLNVSDKIKKIEDELEASRLDCEQNVKRCEDAISEIKKCLNNYTIKYGLHNFSLKQHLENFKEISNILKPDGKVKTILDQLKNKKLTLHGEPGKDQIINLLNYYHSLNSVKSEDHIPLNSPSSSNAGVLTDSDTNEQKKTLPSSSNSAKSGISVQGKKSNMDLLIAFDEKKKKESPRSFQQIKTCVIQNDSSSQHVLKFPWPSTPISAVSDVSVQENSDTSVKPFVISVEKQSTVAERKKILEVIQKHEDKWVCKKSFAANDKVIIFDADATDSPKYKRAEILSTGNYNCTVSLLDFGYKTQVENSSVGEIKDLQIDETSTCFLAQLTGSINVQCIKQEMHEWFELPKAYTIFL